MFLSAQNLQIYPPPQANGKDRAGRAGEEPGIRAFRRRPAICQGTWEISFLGPFLPQGVGDAGGRQAECHGEEGPKRTKRHFQCGDTSSHGSWRWSCAWHMFARSHPQALLNSDDGRLRGKPLMCLLQYTLLSVAYSMDPQQVLRRAWTWRSWRLKWFFAVFFFFLRGARQVPQPLGFDTAYLVWFSGHKIWFPRAGAKSGAISLHILHLLWKRWCCCISDSTGRTLMDLCGWSWFHLVLHHLKGCTMTPG